MPTPADRPLVLGHRGASSTEAENTIRAFEVAAAVGADGVELDVRLTVDDVMVVHHDPRVAGFGTIWNQDFATLRAARPEIPTLDEALAACGSMLVDIELKNHPSEPGFDPTHRVADAVVDWVEQHGAADRVVISSFGRDTIARVKELTTSVPTGQLVHRGAMISDWITMAADDGHEWILPHRRYLKRGPRVVEQAHSEGLSVGVWTVDTPRWLRRFAEYGVDAVITNDPAAALEIYSD